MAGTGRAVAKLTVTFGLVSLPVRLLKATDSPNGTGLHQYHGEDNGRIRYDKRCESCGEVITAADIVKGLESSGDVVVITEEDMETLPLASTKEIEVLQFSDAGEIPALMYRTTYYLEPDGPGSVRAYALLQGALAKTKRVGICKMALRSDGREHLAALRIEGGVLALTTLTWPKDVRHVHFDDLDGIEVAGPTLKMATQLVDSMTAKFDPEKFEDEYAKALSELVDAKVAGKVLTPAPKKKAAATTSLDDLLKASLAGKKAS
jgi:DNA end-binding protein Ku